MSRPKKAQRTIKLARPANALGVAVVQISLKAEHQFYAVREIPCAIGGRGFAVHRLGLGGLYHVRVGRREDCSCECLGWLAHDRCKHVSGLAALIKQGLL